MSSIDQILDIVAEKANVDRASLKPEAKLGDLNISSLDMVEVLFALEEKLGIQFDFNANSDSGNFRTLGDVITEVEKRLGN